MNSAIDQCRGFDTQDLSINKNLALIVVDGLAVAALPAAY